MMVGGILRSHQELAAGGVWVSAWICERTDCRIGRWLILRHSSSAVERGRKEAVLGRVMTEVMTFGQRMTGSRNDWVMTKGQGSARDRFT